MQDLFDVSVLDGEQHRRQITVFRQKDLDGLAASAGATTSGDDHSTRLKATLRHLRSTGGKRPLADPPDHWEVKVADLLQRFPNFRQVIEEAIAPSLAIASQGGYVRPPPVLLVGPPGCGKSYFAQTVANMLGVPLVKQDMSTATTSCVLSGLAPYWGNSSPGEVFKTLAFGRGGTAAVANPCFFLDEIDKVAGDHRYDPLAPLYSLLEIESATQYEDEALPGLRMDASHIRWLLTANDASAIPGPILSRLLVFRIQMPDAHELRVLNRRIFEAFVESSGLPSFSSRLPRGLDAQFLGLGPREFKTRCAMAIGKAIRAGRQAVFAQDFAMPVAQAKKRIGFV
ncbi:AAA family ATPase [Variovorax sp. J31P207]|uniref:AAA family ATPase n=1 Tax=Variovorax sp. J31P207 TaxID=3053510 RepID=UPI0025786087|nr:AAA family ATPase [Variovorax sp. J31P207]MDM0071470.1 AAA family ATPase [Variovorax sp. J31P207]